MAIFRGILALAALTAALAFLACQKSESEPAAMDASPLATATAAPPSPSASPTSTPALSPSPSPSAQPPSSPSPEPPAAADSASIALSPAAVNQGEVFTVTLQGNGAAGEAAVILAGLQYPLLHADGTRWAVIGIAADFVAGRYEVQIKEGGRLELPAALLTVLEAAFPEEFIELAPEQSQLLTDPAAIEEERQLLASIYAGVTPDRLWSGPFVLPAVGPTGDTFGMRRSFDGGPFSQHTGVDILAGEGQPVVAANSGRVAFAGELYLRGGSVIIDHGAGVFSGYHHLSQVLVVEGQEVAQGEVVGSVGGTGLATAPHLHWEIVVHGVRVDPIPWTQAEIGP